MTEESTEYVLCFKSIVRAVHDGEPGETESVDFARPKYWTGGMLERWPELTSNKNRAHRFSSKQAASEVRSGFANRGFFGSLESA